MWEPDGVTGTEVIKFYCSDIDRLEKIPNKNKQSLMQSPKTLKESMFSIFEDTAIDLQKKLEVNLGLKEGILNNIELDEKIVLKKEILNYNYIKRNTI